jgi:pimeloyl-ACP methyl ester carboxylesterase
MWCLPFLCLLAADSTVRRTIPVAPAESLQVTLAGSGSPVVLVPGLFGAAYGFRKVIPLLAERHRVIVVEPLGVGTSSRPERADYSLDAQAERLAAALDSLGVRQATVAAHSLGAGMAFRLAYRRPDLVAALVSLDGGPAERAATAGLKRAAAWAPWVKVFGGVRLVRRKIGESLVRASGDTSWVSEEVVEGYTEAAARDLDGTLKAYIRMGESREHEKLAPHLKEIRCPVVLVLGTAPHPEAVSPKETALLHSSLGELRVDSIAGAGHHLHEERPDLVAAAIEAAAGSALAGR